MAWPTGNVSLSNVDAESDSISSARSDIYSAFTKLNEIITNGPGTGNVTVYNDDNVAAYLPTHTGNISANVITTTGGVFWANGTAYSTGGGGGGSYGNVDVAAYLPTYTGNVAAGNVTVTTNVTANKFIGDGSLLTNLPGGGSYGNTQVAAYLLGNTTIGTIGQTTSGQTTLYGKTVSVTGYGAGGSSGTTSITGHKTLYLLNGGTSGTLIRAETDNFTVVPVYGSIGTFTLNNFNLVISAQGSITTVGNVTLSQSNGWFNGNVKGNITSSGTSTFGPYIERVYAIGNTGAGTITPVFSNGPVQTMTATGNFTLAAPTGMTAGASLSFIIRQDATGVRICSFNSAYKFANGSKTLSTTANSIDVVTVFYDGTDYLCGLNKGFV